MNTYRIRLRTAFGHDEILIDAASPSDALRHDSIRRRLPYNLINLAVLVAGTPMTGTFQRIDTSSL